MVERAFGWVLAVSVLLLLAVTAILAPGPCLQLLAYGVGGVAILVVGDRLAERRRVRRVVRRLETLTTGELHAEVLRTRAECLRYVPAPNADLAWFDELVRREDLRGLAREWPRMARGFAKHFDRDFPRALADLQLVLAELVRRADATAAASPTSR